MKKVVLDTNTLISGLLWDGNEARVIEKAENKEIKLFISPELIEELEGVLKREKFCKRLEEKKLFRFAEQLRGAGMSMSNNIAEGSGSTSKKEFIQFLNIARSSTDLDLSSLFCYNLLK